MARSVSARSERFFEGRALLSAPEENLFSPQENRRTKELCWEKESLATALSSLEYLGLSRGALWRSRRRCLSESPLVPLSTPPPGAPVSPPCPPGAGEQTGARLPPSYWGELWQERAPRGLPSPPALPGSADPLPARPWQSQGRVVFHREGRRSWGLTFGVSIGRCSNEVLPGKKRAAFWQLSAREMASFPGSTQPPRPRPLPGDTPRCSYVGSREGNSKTAHRGLIRRGKTPCQRPSTSACAFLDTAIVPLWVGHDPAVAPKTQDQ